MKPGLKLTVWLYAGATLAALAVGMVRVIEIPVDPVAGPAQKLLYLHLPAAANALLGALTVCIASAAYISRRGSKWDDLAHAASEVTVLNATVLLITGMFWAKALWGHWWLWSPRLTFSLVLWTLYAAALFIRFRGGSTERCAMVSAVYGIIAFLDVPMLYLASKLLPDIHPATSGFESHSIITILIWMLGITMLSAGTVALRFLGMRNGSPGDQSIGHPTGQPSGTLRLS